MRKVAMEFERISDVCGCWVDAIVDDAFDKEAVEGGGVAGSLTFELVEEGFIVVTVTFVMAMGLSLPTSNTSIFIEEHFASDG